MRRSRIAIHMIVALVLMVSLLQVGCSLSCRQEHSPKELLQIALSDATEAEREDAVVFLGEHPDQPVEELRDVSRKSPSDRVRAAAAVGLGRMRDWESIPHLVEAMESPSALLRGRAAAAVNAIVGEDFGFRAHDPEPSRQNVIAEIRRKWPTLYQGYLVKEGYSIQDASRLASTVPITHGDPARQIRKEGNRQ